MRKGNIDEVGSCIPVQFHPDVIGEELFGDSSPKTIVLSQTKKVLGCEGGKEQQLLGFIATSPELL